MNVTTLTRNSSQEFSAALRASPADTYIAKTIDVPVEAKDAPTGDTYTQGCRFHALLRRISDNGPLNAAEKQMLPWLTTARGELRKAGVTYIEPEVSLGRSDGETSGQCDLLLEGGYADIGVAEFKVVSILPEQPQAKHLFQLACYAELTAGDYDQPRVWGALAYVSFSERKVRLFSFKNTVSLRRHVRPLLAA